MSPRLGRGAAALAKRLFLLLFVWPLLAPVWSQTAPSAPAISRNEALVAFPETITFELEWQADRPLQAATLTYDVVKASCLDVATQVPVPVTGDHLSWEWVLTRSGNLPPGAEVWWQWTVTDDAGNMTTTPRQQIRFDDSRYAWQRVEAPGIRLYWYQGNDVGPALLQAAVEALNRLEQEMGIMLQDPATFFIYGSAEEMRQAVLYRQDWAGGLAFSDYNTILIGVPPSAVDDFGRRTVAHELAHLVVAQFGRSCVGGSRPTWLDEGLAVYAEGTLDPAVEQDLVQGIRDNSFEPLRSLNGAFPAHGAAAGIAYSQSYSVVDFLIGRYGREELQALLLTLADGAGYDEAWQQVYGFNTDGLEEAWREELGLPARPIPPTPTPLTSAGIPTIAPLAGPQSLPTPPPGATRGSEPAGSAPGAPLCGLALAPLVALAWWRRRKMPAA